MKFWLMFIGGLKPWGKPWGGMPRGGIIVGFMGRPCGGIPGIPGTPPITGGMPPIMGGLKFCWGTPGMPAIPGIPGTPPITGGMPPIAGGRAMGKVAAHAHEGIHHHEHVGVHGHHGPHAHTHLELVVAALLILHQLPLGLEGVDARVVRRVEELLELLVLFDVLEAFGLQRGGEVHLRALLVDGGLGLVAARVLLVVLDHHVVGAQFVQLFPELARVYVGADAVQVVVALVDAVGVVRVQLLALA